MDLREYCCFWWGPEHITLSGRSAGAYAVRAQALYDFRGELPEH